MRREGIPRFARMKHAQKPQGVYFKNLMTLSADGVACFALPGPNDACINHKSMVT